MLLYVTRDSKILMNADSLTAVTERAQAFLTQTLWTVISSGNAYVPRHFFLEHSRYVATVSLLIMTFVVIDIVLIC